MWRMEAAAAVLDVPFAADALKVAPWAVIASSTFWPIALATIAVVFSAGEPWGTINDVASLFQWLFAIPVVVVVYHAERDRGLAASITFVIGLLALVAACLLTVLLLARVLTFAQQGRPVAIAGGLYGVWLVIAAVLWLGHAQVPAGLLAVEVIAGLGTSLAIIGYLFLGQSHWVI